MMDRTDLQQLADTPGYGNATSTLKTAGLWDEFAGAGQQRQFTVYLSGTFMVPAWAHVLVTARSADEAEALVTDLASAGRVSWEFEDPEEWKINQVVDSLPASSESDSFGQSDSLSAASAQAIDKTG